MERFASLRQTLACGQWAVPPQTNGLPTPSLYLALLAYPMSRADVEALATRLKLYRDDLGLLHQVVGVRDREADLDRPNLSNREVYHLLRHSSTEALMIVWLCTGSARVQERLWYFETELRHIQPEVDGEYLKSLGLKPSPLYRKLLHAVRDARLDGKVDTVAEEKALVAQLLEEDGRLNGKAKR